MDILFTLLSIYLIYKLYSEGSRKYESRLLRRRIRKTSSDMVVILDKSLRVIGLTKYDRTIFPYFPEELIGVNVWSLLPSDLAIKVYKAYCDAVRTHSVVTIEHLRTSEEKCQCYRVKFLPLCNKKTVICFITDVTERYEEELFQPNSTRA